MVGATDADSGRRCLDTVPGPIEFANPARDDAKRARDEAQAEVVSVFAFGGKPFGDKLGSWPNRHNAGVSGLKNDLGGGHGAHPLTDKNHIAFAQVALFSGGRAAGRHITTNPPNLGKRFVGVNAAGF